MAVAVTAEAAAEAAAAARAEEAEAEAAAVSPLPCRAEGEEEAGGFDLGTIPREIKARPSRDAPRCDEIRRDSPMFPGKGGRSRDRLSWGPI